MEPIVTRICRGTFKLSIAGSAERILIDVRDGASARFWCDASELDNVMEGTPLQMSNIDGSCLIALEGDFVSIRFEKDERRKNCSIHKDEFLGAVQMVRDQHSQYDVMSDAIFDSMADEQ